MKPRAVWSLAEAREALMRLIGARRRLDDARRLADRLRGRAEVSPHRARILVLRLAGAGARRADRTQARRGLRAALDAPARGRAPASRAETPMMGNVAKLFETDPPPRFAPEDLRIAEAMVFAAAEPIDEAAIAARLSQGADVGAAMAELQRALSRSAASTSCGSPAAGCSAPRPIWPGCWRAKSRRSASCRARRSRRWRSSPITSR